MNPKRINSLSMKEKNRSILFSIIRGGERTRADVARGSGLSRAAVSIIVDQLISEGVLAEGETVKGKVGRSGTVLRFATERYYAIGIALRRDCVSVGKVNLNGEITQNVTFPLSETDERESVLTKLHPYIVEMLQDPRIPVGIGVVAPGPIDTQSGTILTPPHWKNWHNFAAAAYFSQTYGVPCHLENESGALAVSEYFYGIGKGLDSFVEIVTDTGIGTGIVVRGKLYRGTNGLGSELGHTTVDINGPTCDCGNRGCYELYACLSAVIAYAKTQNPAFTSWKIIADAAEAGDQTALAIIDRQANYLSSLATTAVNAFDIKSVVIHGEMCYRFHLLKERMAAHCSSRLMAKQVSEVDIYASNATENTHTLAAACIALNVFFSATSTALEELGQK